MATRTELVSERTGGKKSDRYGESRTIHDLPHLTRAVILAFVTMDRHMIFSNLDFGLKPNSLQSF